MQKDAVLRLDEPLKASSNPTMLRVAIVAAMLLTAISSECSKNGEPEPMKITKIVISLNCLAPCIGYQIGLYADGTYRYTQDGLPSDDEEEGQIPFASFATSIVDTEFFHDRASYPKALGRQQTAVWVEYDSTQKLVVLDTTGQDQPNLRNLIQTVRNSVADKRAISRRAWEKRLTNYADARLVRLQVGGCLGFCREYDVTFDKSGRAYIEYIRPRHYPRRTVASAFVGLTEYYKSYVRPDTSRFAKSMRSRSQTPK